LKSLECDARGKSLLTYEPGKASIGAPKAVPGSWWRADQIRVARTAGTPRERNIRRSGHRDCKGSYGGRRLRFGELPAAIGGAGGSVSAEATGEAASSGLDRLRLLRPSFAWIHADPTSASTLLGSAESARSKKPRACTHIVRGPTFIEPSQTLKREVHRVGGRGLFGAPRISGNEFGAQRACHAIAAPSSDDKIHFHG
jgi:hypothetical protein